MKYIEVSKKISLTKKASQEDIKKALIERIERAFKVEKMKKTKSGFHCVGKTGALNGLVRHARVGIDAQVIKNQDTVRVIINAQSEMAKSLLVSYTALFFLVLMAGLLPGSIETNGESSGALDALVFMIFGIFIFFDINKKLCEPKQYLEAVLASLDVEYG